MAKVTEKIHINDVYNGKTSLSAAANSSFLHFFIYGKLNRCDKVRHYQTPFSGKSNLCFSPFCYFHSYLRCSCCSFDLLIKIQSSICSPVSIQFLPSLAITIIMFQGSFFFSIALQQPFL